MTTSNEFKCTSDNPFVLVRLDGSDVSLDQAIDLVTLSDFCPKALPVATWLPDHRFQDNNEILSDEQKVASSLVQALRVVEDSDPSSLFIIGADARCLREEYLDNRLQKTIMSLQQHDVPSKRMVLIADHGTDPTPFFDNCKFGTGRIVAEADERRSSGTPCDLDRLIEAIMQDAPKTDEAPWPFDDDPDWIEAIDSLSRQDAETLFERGGHLPALERLRRAKETVQSRFVSRSNAFDILTACALAKTNSVMLGPPGTAKSLMVRSFAQAMGVRSKVVPISEEDNEVRRIKQGKHQSGQRRRFFEYLLTRYTTPEELFGGTDIDALVSRGVHCRRTLGMLPQAEIAFLDEIFKANSAILNTLLSIINEGIFYNMGQPFKVNVAFVVGASNETPDEEELGALFDRFPVRIPCYPVPENSVAHVIDMAHQFVTAGMFSESVFRIRRIACLNDLRLLAKLVQGVAFGGDKAFGGDSAFEDAFMDLCLAIRRDYGVSDRTPIQMLRLCRALALLEGADSLAPKHLRVWGYVAPKLAQFEELQRAVRVAIQERDPSAAKLFDEV